MNVTTDTSKSIQGISLAVAYILLAGATVGILISLFSGMQTNTWQYFAQATVFLFFGMAIIFPIRRIQRNDVASGVRLILLGLPLVLFVTNLLLADLGLLLALTNMLLMIVIAIQITPGDRFQRAILFAFITSLAIYGVDFLPLEYRLSASPVFRRGLAILGGIIVLTNVILIIKRYHFYSLGSKINTISAILVSVLVIVFFVVAMSFYITFVARTSENLVVSLDIQSENITKPLTSASGDVRLLSRLKSLENYLLLDSEYMSTKEDARSDAIADFVALFEEHPIYDQIRFLDPTGQEIIRINRGDQGSPIVVPKDQLQNKDDRYYFQQSIGLPSGEIYISPLDLNVEHNEIEVPYKPVIRYATPVVYNGVTYGVVVTNVLADFFLEPLDSNVMLIDTDGYYLHHPDPEKRWGRDLNTGITFVQDFPDLIATMTSNTEGVLTSNGTIFAYQPITLPGENAPRWWIINFVNIEESISNVRQAMQISLLVLGIAFLIAISATTFLAGNIVRPLQLLTDAALRVSVGDLNVDLDIHSSDEIGILATAFNNMTAQIKNLISELEQQIRALKMSTEVSRRLSTILERDRLISAVVDQLQSAFGYYHVHIYLFDDTRQNLVMTSGAGEPGRIMREREHTIPLGKGLVGRAAATNQGILASDTSQEPDWLPNELLPETRAEAALPIAIGNTVLGVLDVQENKVGGLTEDDQELLQAIASQVAIAVQNAQSYEQARRQAERESLIVAISQRIQAATTIDEVLQVTITELGRTLDAKQAKAELRLKPEADDDEQIWRSE